MDQQEQKQWAIVDLFGHVRIAGEISSHEIGGAAFVRVDVPASDSTPGFTKLLGNGAIYAITFVAEEIARAAAKSFRAEPVSAYEIPELRQLRLRAGHADLRTENAEGHTGLDSGGD